MGNCLIWEKVSTSPEEKLYKEIINDLKKKRVMQILILEKSIPRKREKEKT